MSEVAPFAAEERRKCIWCLIYLMSGSKAPDYDIGAGHKVILPLVCEHTWRQTF